MQKRGPKMADKFKKLMRSQVQESLNDFSDLAQKSVPRQGWIRTLREALGMSSYALAKRMGCTRSNIAKLEKREAQGTITLEALTQAAQAMNCKLVYCLVPLEPLDQQLHNQARIVAQHQMRAINQSMELEQQGLSDKQLQQQEDELVEELLQGNLKKLWNSDEF
jgi:predicted DNA-binding mobile mystery protein A